MFFYVVLLLFLLDNNCLSSSQPPLQTIFSPNTQINAHIFKDNIIVNTLKASTSLPLQVTKPTKYALSNNFSYGDDTFIMLALAIDGLECYIYALIMDKNSNLYKASDKHITKDTKYFNIKNSAYTFNNLLNFYFDNNQTLFAEFFDPQTTKLIKVSLYTPQDFINNQMGVQSKRKQQKIE